MDDESEPDHDYESDGPYCESKEDEAFYEDVSDDEISNSDVPPQESAIHDSSDSSSDSDDSDAFHDDSAEAALQISEEPKTA